MSRATGVSRRQFCGTVGGLVVITTVSACTGENPRLTLGGDVGDEDPGEDPTADMASSSGSADLKSSSSKDMKNPDLTSTPVNDCSGLVDCGAATAVADGSATRYTDNNNYDFFLCRDAGGLYALSSLCPHDYRPVKKQSTRFYCPYHGATFDLNGQKPTRPAKKALEHYALCVDADGNVTVDYSTVVDPSTRT